MSRKRRGGRERGGRGGERMKVRREGGSGRGGREGERRRRKGERFWWRRRWN